MSGIQGHPKRKQIYVPLIRWIALFGSCNCTIIV
jgi:hypothetical protein